MHLRLTHVVLLVGLLSIAATAAQAARRPLTFSEVCSGYTVSKRGTDVIIRCPGDPTDQPWFTFKNCPRPVVDRSKPGLLTITCT